MKCREEDNFLAALCMTALHASSRDVVRDSVRLGKVEMLRREEAFDFFQRSSLCLWHDTKKPQEPCECNATVQPESTIGMPLSASTIGGQRLTVGKGVKMS